MGKIIGIDLGTTNSVVAVMEGGKPTVIANIDGSRLTPSVVGFTKEGERLVGITAKRQAVTNPSNTVYSIKRFMGRRRSEVKTEEKMVPYKIEGGTGTDELAKVRIGDKTYTPPEISAMILASLKNAAEQYLGEKITEAVITVPAYFNDSQRQATKDAGVVAGLNVRRIINEPTAAALAYGLEKKKNEKIIIFDLGGGTFDVSVLEVGDGVFEVKAINGDTHLGGDDFDEVVVNWLADEFKKEQGIDLRKDQMALQRLKEASEKAKCELSTVLQTEINLPFITADQAGPKHLTKKLTRAQFEQMVSHLIEKCRKPCMQALEDAKISIAQLDEVVLVGGSTRMPCAQRLVKEIFNKEPNKSVNPDEVVAVGAAIQGGILQGDEKLKEILLLDITPLSLGIETLGGVMTTLIARGTTIPTEKKEVFSTAEDNQTAVDVHVLQGERPMATHNRTLGRFRLEGIPPARRSVPQIEVSFNIDANGILHVSAKDMGTGKAQSIQIKHSSGLNEAEINKMKREAEQYAEEDKLRKGTIELRNKADNMLYSTEKIMKEHESKIPADLKKKIDEQKDKLKKAIDSNNNESIQKAMDEFVEASQAIGQAMYTDPSKAAGAPGDPNANAAGNGGKKGKSDDGVIDAEYEVKD